MFSPNDDRTYPYTKTIIRDGKEVTVTVLPPSPEHHDDRTWPHPKPGVNRPIAPPPPAESEMDLLQAMFG